MTMLTTIPRRFKLFGATLAMAALAAALLTVFFTAGPTQAQSEAYEDPKPCGPGFDEFYDLPVNPHDEVDSGHYAIFDAYYDLDADEPHRPTKDGEAWAGLLSLNFCTPTLEVRDDDGNITTTRKASNVDIDKTVFHVDQVTHTLTTDEAAAYPFLGDAGDQVFWLRVGDDPNTSATEQTSALQLSFSTALFDPDYWDLEGSEHPFWYEVEAERELGIHPREYGHIYVFDDSDVPEGETKAAIWDSGVSDTGKFDMEAGVYRDDLQWVFTKTGTYELSVHLNGHVRKAPPEDLPEGEKWHPASEENVVTSQVKKYIFHVGPLTLNEQPMFQVERSIRENSHHGAHVGTPVQVAPGDYDPLDYVLSGPGHTNFTVERAVDEHSGTQVGAQIKVADGAHLDYELRASYDLALSVSDGKDREDNADASVDHTIAVHIEVTDVPDADDVGLRLTANPETQAVQQAVTLTATPHNVPEGQEGYILDHYAWVDSDGSVQTGSNTYQKFLYEKGTRDIYAELQYQFGGHTYTVRSNTVRVTWSYPQPSG